MRDKRVLITGASGGLGVHVVEASLAMGADVIATARRRTGLNDVCAAARHHDRLHVAESDVSDPQSTEALFDAVERRGALDVVVHCVGTFSYGPLSDITDSDARKLIDTNLTSTVWVMRAALSRMKQRGQGVIIVIASEKALTPEANVALYGASKQALTYLIEAAAKEVKNTRIRIHAIAPGTMNTPDNRSAMPKADISHWVEPGHVAKTIVWLASDDAAAVHGSTVRMPER